MKAFLAFLMAHKTKLTGAMLVSIGSLQANSAFFQAGPDPLLTPRQFSVFTIGAGMFVALLGFLNNPKPKNSG